MNVKIKITELNQIFHFTIFSSDKHPITKFPSYIELNCATSIDTYNNRKSDIELCLKNKPTYKCKHDDENKLPVLLMSKYGYLCM